jgi:predicted membrane channel-forming protein YqfA (hemolysin III family)
VRATYGGLFFVSHAGVALALIASPKIGACMAAALGLAWSGAALGRIVSMAIDRAANRFNLFATLFEGLMGIALATPLWAYLRLIYQGNGVV